MTRRLSAYCSVFLLTSCYLFAQETIPIGRFLDKAKAFEAERKWQQAADVYEKAIRYYPKQKELFVQWQRIERVHSLVRRYNDDSFRNEMLTLSEADAITLLQETYERIFKNYVESVSYQRLIQLGFENVRMALDESPFLKQQGLTAGSEAQRALLALVDKLALSVPADLNQEDALNQIRSFLNQATALGAKSRTAFVLEFLAGGSEGLDPYSTQLTPNRLRDLYSTIDGNFVGLGIEVRAHAKGLEIMQVLEESPAEQAGLKEQCVITSIDGQNLLSVHSERAANLLQGVEGSTVRLNVLFPNETQPKELAIVRREVVVRSVTELQTLDPKRTIGFFRLTSFQRSTLTEMDNAINKLDSLGVKKLVIDVRGNPGGLLDMALQIANRFVPEGVLLSTKGRSPNQSWVHRARTTNQWNMPLVVLIDSESASASEIFAGCIKDHARGQIVGTRSYGKGSVQTIFPLRAIPGGLRMTTAHFFSPKGLVYQYNGVTPDIEVSRELGPLGEELPLPRKIDARNDRQLVKAYQLLATNDTVANRTE